MNQDSETVPMNQDAETVPMNKDDSLEQLLSQNFVENDNDSFDDMVSQTSEQEYRQNDSLDEFITQSDQLRESSANSKVNDWLVKENSRPIEAQNTNLLNAGGPAGGNPGFPSGHVMTSAFFIHLVDMKKNPTIS